MAKQEKQLEIFLSLKDRFTAALGKIRRRVALWARRVKRSVQLVTKAFFGLKRMLVLLAGVYVLGRLAKSFLKAAADMETYRMQLIVLYRDVGRATRVFEELRRFAAASPLETQEVIAGFVRLKAVGVDAVREVIKELGDLSIVMNRSLYDVVAAYINPQKEILVKLGIDITRQGDIARIQSGNILKIVKNNNREIRKALRETWGEQFAGAMEKMAGTMNARLAVLRSAIWDFQAEVGSVGREHAKKLVDWISDMLNRYRTTVANMAREPLDAWIIVFDYIKDAAPPVFAKMLALYVELLVQMTVVTARLGVRIFWPLTKAFASMLANLKPGLEGFYLDRWKEFQESVTVKAQMAMMEASNKLDAIQAKVRSIEGEPDSKDKLEKLRKAGQEARRLTEEFGRRQREWSEANSNLEGLQDRINVLEGEIAAASVESAKALEEGLRVTFNKAIEEVSFAMPILSDKLMALKEEAQARIDELKALLTKRFDPAAQTDEERVTSELLALLDWYEDQQDALRSREAQAWQEMLEDKNELIVKYADKGKALIVGLNRLYEIRRAGFFKGEPGGTYENIESQMMGALNNIQEASQALRNSELEGWKGFREGMVAGWEESGRAAVKNFDDAKEAAKRVRESIEGGLTNALQSIVERTATVKDAFREMALSILKEINSIIIKLLIVQPLMNALGGWMGGLFGGGGTPNMHPVPLMDSGGIVQGPALVPVGPIREAFVPLPPAGRTADVLGRSERNEVNIVFSIQAMDGQSVAAAMQKERGTIENVIIDAMSRKRSMRQAVQGATT